MSIAYAIIHDSPSPRVFPEMKHWLQAGKYQCTGDWFLSEDCTEIRVYGAEVAPYRLPVFPVRRVYALEYIWQALKADQLHFFPAKKGCILRLPIEIGPFAVNSRHALPIVEKMLQDMGLRLGKSWAYDP